MIFAKLENNLPIFCPRNGYRGKVAISNLPEYYKNHPEEAKADGWLEFIPCEEESENGYRYTIKDGKIIMEVT